MEKWTLYLGLNDKDSKVQKISTLEAYKVVSNLIATKFDGGTIFEAKGIYKHDNGVIVTENTLRIELLFAPENEVRELVKTLKVIFNQESIAVQKEVINSELW
ncbi:MAG: DUF3574 domain-containing protein [Bacteroidetes bacterium]|uniref:DUF3574 domain-containing protein n=1 Tax=Candidatus Merdivivens pullicola TaxID=2840872 RepID=A0A9D9NGS7_9BACT|nr:DUF3574 domain-containing protein [Candidatus Merdivivens pullicola]